MTTNDKEYMRVYQAKRRAKIKNVKKDVKIVKKSVKILENLHPPPEAKGDMDMDFYAIANSSDFQRFIVFLAKKITPGLFSGVSTRATSTKMKQQFNDTRGDYRLVMVELKEKLKERKERVE